MSVIAVGTDIVDIRRIENMTDKAKLRLAQRVLVDEELAIFLNIKQANSFLAKRWAAKEATAKALGTGIAAGVSFQHISIRSLISGQPKLELKDQALKKAKQLGAKTWHVSLSDEKNYALAFVVLS